MNCTSIAHVVLFYVLAKAGSAAPPTINFPPRDQAAILYQRVAFGVIASPNASGPLVFQWRKDGVPIPGANNDQIVFAQAKFSDAGRYSVVVSNTEDSVSSEEVRLTVNPPAGGDIDFSFAPQSWISGSLGPIAIQSDGKILITGDFTSVQGEPRRGLARLNVDGSIDHTFMDRLSGPDSGVASIALQADGKIIIGGYFGTVNDVGKKRIARLNADGSLDNSFQDGLSALGASITSLAVQRDGKILVGGGLATANLARHYGLARLNADGSLDTGFQQVPFGDKNWTTSIAVQGDGKILITVFFITADGERRSAVTRLNADGTLENGFQPWFSGIDEGFWSMALQSDGKILVVRLSATPGDLSRNGVARLNADGTLDRTFQNGLSRIDGTVSSLAMQSDGKILVGGYFTAVNGVSRTNIARLDADGTLDDRFRSEVSEGISSVTMQGDGKVLITGNFITINGVRRIAMGRLNRDGSLDDCFLSDQSRIRAFAGPIAVQSDGKVLAVGWFYGPHKRSILGLQPDAGAQNMIIETMWSPQFGVARLNFDGSVDTTFHDGLAEVALVTRFDVAPTISCLAVQPDGKVLIGGGFNRINGERSRTNFARLNADGSLDTGFLNGLPEIISGIHAIAIQSDGKVIIGGGWTSRTNLARLITDGSLDTGFLNGLSGPDFHITSVAVQKDGQVLIAGGFSEVNGVRRHHLARLNGDGSLDDGFLNGLSGPDYWVWSLAVQEDGKALIGGGFSTVNSTSRQGIARLNPDGSLDSSFLNGFSGANGEVHSIASLNDGKVLIAGYFTMVNGMSRRGIARLNSDGSLDKDFQNGTSSIHGNFTSVAVQSDGNVLVSGEVLSTNSASTVGLARLWGSENVPPRIHTVKRTGTDMTLMWDGLPNRMYRVQYKDSLSGNPWTDLAGEVSRSLVGTASKTDRVAGNASQRFYRVILLP